MLFILPILLLFYVPVEIYFNGFNMVWYVVLMLALFLIPLPLHHFRYFRLAHYYIFIIGNLMIFIAGLIVGKGIYNYVALLPVVLMGVIIFKTKGERIISFIITLTFYCLLIYLLDHVQPVVFIAPEVKGTFAIIFFILAMTLNFLLGFYSVGINQEYEKIVVEQKVAIELKNKEITDSINYAKRIQDAILPPLRLVNEYLPHSFILYKPKDIVAGDFYWVEKKDDIVLFAAADCTGHGVPGAMVSVVCNNALNRCVREFQLTQPSKILDKAREIIIEEFQRSDAEVKDGMDISMCALNKSTNELQWAGAHNPLLIIRQGEFIEIKADKQPVGKFIGSKHFTQHIIQLQKNDWVYLFTDGYSDQFGGQNGKKFKYNSFKKLLLEYHHLSPAQQKEKIDAALETWKGQLEQVDDVCVIGVYIS